MILWCTEHVVDADVGVLLLSLSIVYIDPSVYFSYNSHCIMWLTRQRGSAKVTSSLLFKSHVCYTIFNLVTMQGAVGIQKIK